MSQQRKTGVRQPVPQPKGKQPVVKQPVVQKPVRVKHKAHGDIPYNMTFTKASIRNHSCMKIVQEHHLLTVDHMEVIYEKLANGHTLKSVLWEHFDIDVVTTTVTRR